VPTDPHGVLELLKQAGLLGLCVLLGWLLKWALVALLAAKDTAIAKLEADLEKVKAQRDTARDKVLEERERYHRLAEGLRPAIKEQVAWFEYFAQKLGTPPGGPAPPRGRQPAPPALRSDAGLEENEGTGS